MRDHETHRIGLPRLVVKLGWISFFTDIASEMIYPIMPLFLTTVLGASRTNVGMIEGFAELINGLLKGWSGVHSDKTRRRTPYIQAGYFLGNIGKPLMAFAPNWFAALAIRSADRLGKGLRTSSRDAMIADVVTPETKGRAFGFHRSMDNAGGFVGVLLGAGLLYWLPGNFKAIFLIAGIPGAAAVAITFLLKDAKRESVEAPETTKWQRISGLPLAFWVSVGLCALFAFANSSDAFLFLRANQAGLSTLQVQLVYALFNLVYVVSAYPFGILSDRIGRWPVLAGGWVLYALCYLGFGFLGGAWMPLLFAIYGIQMGATQGVGAALMADHAKGNTKGTVMGIYYMTCGLMSLMGSLTLGWLWDRSGSLVAFGVPSAVALISVVLIPLTSSARRPKMS